MVKYLRHIFVVIALAVMACSCVKEVQQQGQYGYVQFRVTNTLMQSKAEVDALDRLADARKIKVVLLRKGSTIVQTMPLNFYDAQSANYGIQSDKLGLLCDNYSIEGFYLYDALDNLLISVSEIEDKEFTVAAGGLTLKELGVAATGYGFVSFKLVKDLVTTRSAAGAEYPFSKIKRIDLTVRNVFSGKEYTYPKVKVSIKNDYSETGLQTNFGICDTLATLPRGNYRIYAYTTYADNSCRQRIETRTLGTKGPTFSVEAFGTSQDVNVPIKLEEDAEYIKDYIALKEIWEALDGPHWSYYGEMYRQGANWNFNRDIDLWGNQPGVTLGTDGRVVTLDFTGFGVKGVVPDAIGQLTACQVIYFGTHNELVGGASNASSVPSMTGEQLKAHRLDYYHRTSERDVREDMSEPLIKGVNADPAQRPIIKNTARINPKDITFGTLTNGITGISRAIKRLVNLQQIYIANSPIYLDNFFVDIQPTSPYYNEDLSWSNLETLTDIEIYNCPNLSGLPLEMLTELPDIQVLNASNNQRISGSRLKSDWEALINGASGPRIQILYLGHGNLREFPQHELLKKMSKLGFLDCSYSQVETVHPFGGTINLAEVILDHNRIRSIYPAEDGLFCGMDQLESFTASYNALTEAPDIFNAKSIHEFGELDFSHNNISSFANGTAHKGYNATTINLSYNSFAEFPSQIFKTGSPCQYLLFAGNGLRKMEKGSMTGPKASRLMSLDLSYNKLKELPSTDFYSTNLPYLYGVDLSYNSLEYFPTEVLDGKGVTVLALRHQRDDDGNRTLKTWPTGLYANCPSLQGLYLSSNDIRMVGDIVTPQIPILEISDNPNITVNVSSSYCAYWQMDYVLFIYDKTQDIRGCAAMLQ